MKVCPVGLHPVEVGSTRLRARILQALPVWWGYKYGHKVDYPPHIPGIPHTLIRTGTREIDCSTFTYGLLSAVYPKADWGFERYKKWQMWGRDDLYGPQWVVSLPKMGEALETWPLFPRAEARRPASSSRGHRPVVYVGCALAQHLQDWRCG